MQRSYPLILTKHRMHLWALSALAASATLSGVVALPSGELSSRQAAASPPNCFPAIGFTMPSSVPSSLTNWWCDYDTEYAFVGFSYEITACKSYNDYTHAEGCLICGKGQSLSTLKQDFLNIRQTFNGRYVRLYGFCDNAGY